MLGYHFVPQHSVDSVQSQTKTPGRFQNLYGRVKHLEAAKTILKIGGLTLPHCKTYYKVTVVLAQRFKT